MSLAARVILSLKSVSADTLSEEIIELLVREIRDRVLLPTNRVSCKHIQKLMRILKEEDEALVAAGFMQNHNDDNQQARRCLEILAITLQGLEPAPKPLTCLQQVQVIRTSARNDLTLDLSSRSSASYGGVIGLRQRIFTDHPGTDDSSVHFLLNNKMGPRHKNKLLAGAKVLIFTKNSFPVPELGENVFLLDVFDPLGNEGIYGRVLRYAFVLYWANFYPYTS